MSLIPSGFEQQGAINWDNLALRSVSLSMDILSRCTAAGVDPGTLVLGHLISRHLPLSVKGQRNIRDALISLPLNSSYDKMLWFGFGIKSLARTLGETSEGCSLFALCAALGECFHEEYAAEVIHHLMLYNKVPAEYTPSINQWLMVVRACNGALAMTNFPVKADGFIRLQGLRDQADRTLIASNCPKPDSMAEVLHGVGEVVSGTVDSIHIVGCSATGWVAAFVDWLFDLRLCVQDNQGNIRYSNFHEEKETQILIEFDGNDPTQQLQLASKTCLLKDASDFLESSRIKGISTVTGRLPWDSCIEMAFGTNMLRKIKEHPGLVSRCVSCAATFIYDLRSPYCKANRHPWSQSSVPGQSPEDFTANLFCYFPELRPMAKFVETPSYSEITWEDTGKNWTDLVTSIRLVCGCNKCESILKSGKPKTSRTNTCFTQLLAAVVRCGVALLYIKPSSSLLPTRMGLRSLRTWSRLDKLEELERIRDPSLGLQSWFTVFSGRWPRPRGEDQLDVSAQHHAGLSVFRQVLQQPSTADVILEEELMFTFHSIPGHIEYFGRTYMTIEDPRVHSAPANYRIAANLKAVPQAAFMSVSLRETAKSLLARYSIHVESPREGRPTASWMCFPEHLRRIVHKFPLHRSTAICEKETYRCFDHFQIIPHLEEVSHSCMTLRLNGKKILILTYQQINYAQLVIMGLVQWHSGLSLQIVVDTACISCCLKDALNHVPPTLQDDPQANILGRPLKDGVDEEAPFMFFFVRVTDQKKWDDQIRYLVEQSAAHTASASDERGHV